MNYKVKKENEKLSPCLICKGRGYIIQLDSFNLKKECKFCNGTGIIDTAQSYEYWNTLYASLTDQLEENSRIRENLLLKISECCENLNKLY